MPTTENPLAIYCSACGAPAEFNIVRQSYHCGYCGQDTEVARALAQHRERRDQNRARVYREASQVHETTAHCPNCGADVLLAQSEALAHCDYCGANVVRRSYAASGEDSLPEVIIPFFITRDEAEERVRSWLKKNKRSKIAQAFIGRENEIKAYYLPYEIVRGPLDCTVRRTDADRVYSCGGYIEGVAVNCSEQLDNKVLDAIEPFDPSGAVPFSFAYTAGHKAKLPDIRRGALDTRVRQEVEEAYFPALAKTMHSREFDFTADTSKTLSVPALFPVYFIRKGKSTLALNGQTGRIAASDGSLKKSRSWMLEPILITLFAAILTFALSRMPDLTAGIAFFVLVVSLVILGQRRGQKKYQPVLQGKMSRAAREDDGLLLLEEEKKKEEPLRGLEEPVFFEPVNGEKTTVRIGFYEPASSIRSFFLALIIVLFPFLISFIILTIKSVVVQGTAPVLNAFWGGGLPWLLIAIPSAFAYFLNFGRKAVYNYPIFYKAEEEQRGRRLRSDRDSEKTVWDEIFEVLTLPRFVLIYAACALVTVLVIVLG